MCQWAGRHKREVEQETVADNRTCAKRQSINTRQQHHTSTTTTRTVNGSLQGCCTCTRPEHHACTKRQHTETYRISVEHHKHIQANAPTEDATCRARVAMQTKEIHSTRGRAKHETERQAAPAITGQAATQPLDAICRHSRIAEEPVPLP